MPISSFKRFTNTDLRVKVADIGASVLSADERPPYRELLQNGDADVIGFEPSPEQLANLNKIKGPHETYLPYAVGDGKRHTLHICQAPGMTSLLKPNPAVLAVFSNFINWGRVISTMDVDTVRLDDIPETAGIDMLKIDIQGAELMVFRNAVNRLNNLLVIHTEVEFLPMYIDQPLFADVDMFLRQHGFVLHRFYPLVTSPIAPVLLDNNLHQGISQVFWADAVYVRDFTRLNILSDVQLVKMAMLLHEGYASFDLVYHILSEYDRRNKANLAENYISNAIKATKFGAAQSAA